VGSPFTSKELLSAARSHTLLYPDLPPDDKITQRSKTDWVFQTIAIGQGAWFAANVVS